MPAFYKTRLRAVCSRCGRRIPGGEGYVWRCGSDSRCPAPRHCVRGWHAQCLDRNECRRFVEQRAKAALNAAQHQAPEQLELGAGGMK